METKITSVSPVSDENKVDSPIFSSEPSAGFGTPADDSVEESLNLHDLLVKNPTATFFVRVSGDSMEGARIFDGDILVVDRSQKPQNRSLVVAAVNGELVVKRLRETTAGPQLVSENIDYKPIVLSESDDCFIWGVVVGSARKLT